MVFVVARVSLDFLGGPTPTPNPIPNPTPNLYDILVAKYGSGPSFSVSLLDFLSTSSQTFPQQILQFDVTFMSAAQSVHAEVKH